MLTGSNEDTVARWSSDFWPVGSRRGCGFDTQDIRFSFSFSSRWHRSARKGPYALRPVSQQSPQGCPRHSANICLVEHRSFSTLEGGMSTPSFLHSYFLHAINVVMLWPVHVQKVPQASEHLYPAKLQTRCDISCACQSICPFISTDSGVHRISTHGFGLPALLALT